ncbi:MAG: hypothetical protein ACHQ9S_07165 [Candidatus Binatia bacterium]
MLRCVLIGIVFGILAETSARALSLWIYRRAHYPLVNVLVIFGLVMGGIAAVVPQIGVLPALLLGIAAGLLYEVINLAVLDWWYFPGERLAFIHGHAAIVAVLALLWGVVPVAIAAVHVAVF